jgi:beta-glucosidase
MTTRTGKNPILKKKPQARPFNFPPGFLWGTATSAYQVEGGISHCDWNTWEEKGLIKDRARSGRACNHYELFEKDFELIQKMGHNAHRFSIEWSRVEPEEGKWDEEALQHYRQVLESLRAKGITPMVSLHHFTNPEWLAKYGYWHSPQTVEFFARYVKKVAEALLPLSQLWLTLNEPVLMIYFGYIEGSWPPGRRGFKEGMTAFRHLIEAHARAYHILHETAHAKGLPVSVGVAYHMRVCDPHNFSNPMDVITCLMRTYFLNRLFPECIHSGTLMPPLGFYKKVSWIKGTQDFIGLNYYSRTRLAFTPQCLPDLFAEEIPEKAKPVSDMGWEIYPKGLYRILRYLRRFHLPVYITENGVADSRDVLRQDFITAHLREVARALHEGINIQGYFHWSLMDNFEWLEGFGPRFGLVEIDYNTLERKPRPSSDFYSKIAREGVIEI